MISVCMPTQTSSFSDQSMEEAMAILKGGANVSLPSNDYSMWMFMENLKHRFQFSIEIQSLNIAFNTKWQIRISLGTPPTMACVTLNELSEYRNQCDPFKWNGTVTTHSYKTPKKLRLDTVLETFRFLSVGKRHRYLT